LICRRAFKNEKKGFFSSSGTASAQNQGQARFPESILPPPVGCIRFLRPRDPAGCAFVQRMPGSRYTPFRPIDMQATQALAHAALYLTAS
jgi:hypothetical protein